METAAIAEPPAGNDSTVAIIPRGFLPARDASQPGHDLLPAYRQQAPDQVEAGTMLRLTQVPPVELGHIECFDLHRIGQRPAGRQPREDVLELAFAALLDRLGQVAGEIAEEREWLLRTPFLAHVEHGWHRQQQRDRQRGLDGGGGCQRLETVSERAVSDLVVVLEEVDESNRWQVCTVLPARQGAAMRRRLALIGKAAAQTAQ